MRTWNKTKVVVQTSGDKGSGAVTTSSQMEKGTLEPYIQNKFQVE